ncbi:MAG: hypothetical protein ACI9J3_002329 [Parvicellaceae bacterium]|jgi:hypothetical protein
MKIGRRLRVYMVGVGMGLMAAYFMFGTRSCDWTPGNRVINLIEHSQISISDFKACEMKCYGLTKTDLFHVINDGEVSFSESKTGGDLKEYLVSNGKVTVMFHLDMRDSTVQVGKFVGFSAPCECETASKENLSVLYKPNDLVLEQLIENEFQITSRNDCYFKCHKLDSAYARSVLDDGLVLNDFSFPQGKPNPTFWIQKVRESDTLWFQFEKGTKTRIQQIVRKNEPITCDCD